MTVEDLYNTIKSEFARVDAEIGRGHSDLKQHRQDQIRIFDKLESYKQEITECRKDIQHYREIIADKLVDVTKDVNDLRAIMQTHIDEVKGLKTWLYIFIIGSLASVTCNVILMYISKGGK